MEARATDKEGSGKRIRRPTTFAGFLTNDRQFDNLITGNRGSNSGTPTSAGRAGNGAEQNTKRPRQPRDQYGSGTVRKTPGVQNATRKILEWLQMGDMTLSDIAPNLPKLSRARVEVVLDTLRASGLIQLVRKHSPDRKGVDTIMDVYRFSAGCSAGKALEIGGGVPVALGSIAKRTRTTEQELAALQGRINLLKDANAKGPDGPECALELLRHLIKQERNLEEDPFYAMALGATVKAAAAKSEVEAEAKAAAEAAMLAAGTKAEMGTEPMAQRTKEEGAKVVARMNQVKEEEGEGAMAALGSEDAKIEVRMRLETRPEAEVMAAVVAAAEVQVAASEKDHLIGETTEKPLADEKVVAGSAEGGLLTEVVSENSSVLTSMEEETGEGAKGHTNTEREESKTGGAGSAWDGGLQVEGGKRFRKV
ncbi:unnamed protein product [Choristocarpus tenellus]